nr:unnamed protein product [uncultured bacterium]
MDLLQQIVARAKADKQRIVLPEAEEERTLKAADKVLADDLADIILIGNPANIKNLAAQWGLNNIDKATIVDPQNNPKTEEYAEKLAAVLCLSFDEGIALTEHLRGHHAFRAYLALCESDTGNAPAGFYPG